MKIINHNEDETHPTKIVIDYYNDEHIWMFRPILRKKSDLSQEEFDELYLIWRENGRTDNSFSEQVNKSSFYWFTKDLIFINFPYFLVEKLFEWHFDVFGLIDDGLAIEEKRINTNKIENGI